jgi:hypothetical protein
MEENFIAIHEWLLECTQSHYICQESSDLVELPKRVLEIDPQVWLRATNGEKG